MTPSHIVILNDNGSLTGGSAAVALASAKGLAQRARRVTLVTCVGPLAPGLGSVPNLECVCLGQRDIASDPNRLRAFSSGIRNGAAVAAVRAVLGGMPRRETVVHVHSWTKSLSPFALAAVCEMGFPLVVTLHDFFVACPNGGLFVHGANELCGRRPLSAACLRCGCDRRNHGHKLWRFARTVVQNRILRVPERVSHFVGVSDFSVGIMRPFLPARVPVTVVRNPVECRDLGPAEPGANREFLYVGRLEVEKGARLFAEAAAATGLPATFVGDGALSRELRRICPHARFTGWLPPEAVREHLARARALVVPPLGYETLGMVVIEASAAGVPAIVAGRCAATDVVTDGVNGILFEHGSGGALQAAMRRLAGNDILASRLGRAAYDGYWADPWTVGRHVDRLVEIYGALGEAA